MANVAAGKLSRVTPRRYHHRMLLRWPLSVRQVLGKHARPAYCDNAHFSALSSLAQRVYFNKRNVVVFYATHELLEHRVRVRIPKREEKLFLAIELEHERQYRVARVALVLARMAIKLLLLRKSLPLRPRGRPHEHTLQCGECGVVLVYSDDVEQHGLVYRTLLATVVEPHPRRRRDVWLNEQVVLKLVYPLC